MLELIFSCSRILNSSVLHRCNPTVLPVALEGMGLEEQ